jgi:glycosyltransferase involved in cell wall biosynthesis
VPVRIGALRDLGFWRTPRQEATLRRVQPLLTGFIANSNAVRDHFCRRDGLSPARVAVIPNGMEIGALPFRDHDEPAPAVGIVGNLNREVKRTDLFIEAAGRVAQEHPRTTWHVVGDGSLRARYEARAAALGLGERIIFAGRIADVPAYLEKLAVGVICSDSEGFSNAVLEYMLRGCAVVATDVGGNREAVRDGETGLLVPPGDAAALAAAISRLVGDAELRRRLARRARVEAENRYDWARCVEAHAEHYRSALAAAGRR